MQQDSPAASQVWAPRTPDFSYWLGQGKSRWPDQFSGGAWAAVLHLLSCVHLSHLLLLALVFYFTRYALKARYKTELANQRARWPQISDNQQQFTVAESFTLGWLNVILRHLWPTVLEKELCDKATVHLKVSDAPSCTNTNTCLGQSLLSCGSCPGNHRQNPQDQG